MSKRKKKGNGGKNKPSNSKVEGKKAPNGRGGNPRDQKKRKKEWTQH